MRTLSKPPKTKKIQKHEEKQSQKKTPSKKITKTVFTTPFTSKIQSLSHEDTDELKSLFLPYLKHLRQQMPIKAQSGTHKKFISFKASQNALPTLTSPELILGVRSCISAIKQKDKSPQLVIIFYEEKQLFIQGSRQQLLQELLCRLLKQKINVIVTRNENQIKQQLAVKTVTCIGLRNTQICHKLSKLSMKCSVEIPWLVEKTWIGLKDD